MLSKFGASCNTIKKIYRKFQLFSSCTIGYRLYLSSESPGINVTEGEEMNSS